MSTTPSGVWNDAPTGQTLTQGAFWHCMQNIGMNPPGASGRPSTCVWYTSPHCCPSGTARDQMQYCVH